ncbi:MAG: hypothetical protein ACIAQU_02750 [Phycisphaerales bacterium JB064]
MISPTPRHQPPYQPRGHRPHPAALPQTRLHAADRGTARQRPKPQTIEEAKLNLRVTAARKDHHGNHHGSQGGHGSGGMSGTIASDLASTAIRFAKDHPAALATGIGVVALVVGPGALLKGVTTAARLATVAGFLGKAAK